MNFLCFRLCAYEWARCIVRLFGFQLNNGFFTCVRLQKIKIKNTSAQKEIIVFLSYSKRKHKRQTYSRIHFFVDTTTNRIENITLGYHDEHKKAKLESVQRCGDCGAKMQVIYHFSYHGPATLSSTTTVNIVICCLCVYWNQHIHASFA